MTTASRRPGRPTQAEAERLDEQLREAAVETFLEHGYDGASMEAIARAAGITKQTLYSRYADKRAVFIDVIPWAMSRYEQPDPVNDTAEDDLAAALTTIARDALARATDPKLVRLQRIAMNESGRFPEFSLSGETMAWSPRLRAVMELLRRHQAAGNIEVDDIELWSEHFLTLVQVLPARLADFGVFRSKRQEDRHLQSAVELFMRALRPQSSAAKRDSSRKRRSTV
jgi:TetR/AcrR family transcriptional regulator, mexJK operon transcriptional repressor